MTAFEAVKVSRLDYVNNVTDMTCVGAVGINEAERRIVDIAVQPLFRRMGLGRLLVQLSKCEVAFTVNEEADKFWEHIGWLPSGKTVDKDTVVNVWRHPKSDFWSTYLQIDETVEDTEIRDKSLDEEEDEG